MTRPQSRERQLCHYTSPLLLLHLILFSYTYSSSSPSLSLLFPTLFVSHKVKLHWPRHARSKVCKTIVWETNENNEADCTLAWWRTIRHPIHLNEGSKRSTRDASVELCTIKCWVRHFKADGNVPINLHELETRCERVKVVNNGQLPDRTMPRYRSADPKVARTLKHTLLYRLF